MSFKQFIKKVDLLSKPEVEKVRLLAYFFLRTEELQEFNTSDVCGWFDKADLSLPNTSRLRQNLAKSRMFVKGSLPGTFRLHAKELAALDEEYPYLVEESEEIVSSDDVFAESLVKGTRGFIEQLGRQINASYRNNIFDGCAVLMRRLVEVLLILSYQANGIETAILDPNAGGYKPLRKIIADAGANKTLNLSKDTKECLDDFRTLGNFSAHKIHYNAKRNDIKREILPFRSAVEELLYKAALKT